MAKVKKRVSKRRSRKVSGRKTSKRRSRKVSRKKTSKRRSRKRLSKRNSKRRSRGKVSKRNSKRRSKNINVAINQNGGWLQWKDLFPKETRIGDGAKADATRLLGRLFTPNQFQSNKVIQEANRQEDIQLKNTKKEKNAKDFLDDWVRQQNKKGVQPTREDLAKKMKNMKDLDVIPKEGDTPILDDWVRQQNKKNAFLDDRVSKKNKMGGQPSAEDLAKEAKAFLDDWVIWQNEKGVQPTREDLAEEMEIMKTLGVIPKEGDTPILDDWVRQQNKKKAFLDEWVRQQNKKEGQPSAGDLAKKMKNMKDFGFIPKAVPVSI